MSFGRKRYWLFQVLGWGLFALINVFFAYSFDKMEDAESRRIIFTRLGIFVLLGILFTHIMRYVIIRLNTLQKTVEKQVIHFLLISFFFSLVTAMFYMFACNRLGLLNEGEKRFINKPLLLILSGAFYFFI